MTDEKVTVAYAYLTSGVAITHILGVQGTRVHDIQVPETAKTQGHRP